MLGKRAKPEPSKPLDEEDNPVTQVDFISVDKLKNTKGEPLNQKRQKEAYDPDALPQSVRERYGQGGKKRDEKQARTSQTSKDETKRDSTTSASDNKWTNIYGEASKQIGKLIDKQTQLL